MKSTPQSLIQNLYYPAALGTGLVLFLYRIVGFEATASALTNIANGYAILLIVYFSVSYLSNAQTVYSWGLFIIDLAEVAAILFSFSTLGFLDAGISYEPQWSALFWALTVIPILHISWNYVARRQDKFISDEIKKVRWISPLRLLIALFGALYGYHLEWYPLAALLAFVALQTWYCLVRKW